MKSTFPQTVQLGLKSLLLQKMRAGLAALGIFIGTSTVIWLVAMGEGVSYRAQEQIKELGATNIILRTKKPSSTTSGSDPSGKVKVYGLLRKDFDRVVANVDSIKNAIPMREVRFELRRDDKAADAVLVGCVEEHLELNRLQLLLLQALVKQQ